MADAAPAAHKQHAHLRNVRDRHRVVPGAADHHRCAAALAPAPAAALAHAAAAASAVATCA
eukprot:362540-Chlamydomonas_euryale.AAC.2